MRILIVWRDIPSPSHPSLARPFYFAKYNKIHKITLVSFAEKPLHGDYLCGKYSKIELLRIRKPQKTVVKGMYSLKNKFSYQNIFFSRDLNIFRIYFPAMREKVTSLLSSDKFDIVYADYMMYPYLYNNVKIPVVLEFFSPTLYSLRQLYLHEKVLPRKIGLLLKYYFFKLFEVQRYKEFDAGIYVTETHKELSKPFLPKKSFIIPSGVDLEYFKPCHNSSNSPTLVFSGSMNYLVNVQSILYFCREIYPLVKKEMKDTKLYIVGRSPPDEVRKLSARDSSIIVTGEVKDVRPFICKAQLVIAPITIDDGGIKNKIIEAMAMGKTIISTPLGVRNIEVTDYQNVVIAKNDREFAEKVVELLKDENERNRIGRNARKFVEENYSWEKQTGRLENAFEEVLDNP